MIRLLLLSHFKKNYCGKLVFAESNRDQSVMGSRSLRSRVATSSKTAPDNSGQIERRVSGRQRSSERRSAAPQTSKNDSDARTSSSSKNLKFPPKATSGVRTSSVRTGGSAQADANNDDSLTDIQLSGKHQTRSKNGTRKETKVCIKLVVNASS